MASSAEMRSLFLKKSQLVNKSEVISWASCCDCPGQIRVACGNGHLK